MPDNNDNEIKSIKLENADRTKDDNTIAGEGNLIDSNAEVKFEQDDFSKETKIKIGKYIKNEVETRIIQSQARISYKPDNLENLVDSSLNDEIQPGANSFSSDLSQVERYEFDKTSNSGQFPFRIAIKKNETVSDNNLDPEASVIRSRIGLYKDLNRNKNSSIITKATENFIHENARFSPKEDGTPYITSNNPSEEEAGTKNHVFQQRFGEHSPRKFPTSINEDPTVSIKDMKNLGLRLLLKSSGEAFVPKDTSRTDQILLARTSTTLVPGIARLGLRQKFNRFSPLELLNDAVPDAKKPSVNIDLDGDTIPSYGNMNNPLVPFSAISSSTSSVVVGTLLVLTVSSLLQALAKLLDSDIPSNLISSVTTGTPQTISNQEITKQRLGSFFPKEISSDTGLSKFSQFIGLSGFKDILIKTDNDYSKAVERGVQIFFGLEEGDFFQNFGINVGTSAVRIAESPGYWNTILRNMVRSFTDPLLTISNGIAGVAGKNVDIAALEKTNYDVNPLIGPINDPLVLLESINVVKESKLLKIMNIIASIGDIALNTENGEFISEIDNIADVTSVTDNNTPDISSERINPASLVKKHRLSERVNAIKPGLAGALAWGTSTLPSLFLLNTNRQLAEKLYTGETSNFDEVLSKTKKDTKKTNQQRISSETVKAIEEELDSYYVPFYFHDLRTNEIISFHAFISNMTDSFNVDLAETQAYGRIGSVYSYKNTNRTINVEFKIVSTNKDDFDQMWYKINKLLMFCFPQYTLGRPLSFDDENGQTYNFIQPFSQLPSSSPMIRFRVGDVFKTNYSDIDLARLHGLGQKFFSTPSTEGTVLDEQRQRTIDRKIEEIAKRQKQFNFYPGESFIFNKTYEVIGNRAPSPGSRDGLVINISENGVGFGGGFSIPSVQSPGTISQQNNQQQKVIITAGTKATIVAPLGNDGFRYSIILEPQNDNIATNLDINFARATQSSVISLDFASLYSKAVASIDPASVANDSVLSLEDEGRTEVQSFFSAEENPIFKSFASTRGEGIPGFIKSLSFDWNEAVWETEILNSRAPKWLTVRMDFAPIFDINPGLDADGNMIGAIYNVGDIMNKLKINRDTALSNEVRRIRYNRRKSSATN